jgi:predicted DNA-binding transcriptional regulator YafY
VAVAVRALRAGDRASTVARRPVVVADPPSGVMPATPSAQTLSALQEAARDGKPLWIGYVNAQGRATQRVVEPMTVDGGYLRAFDHLRDEVRTFAVHRITGVADLDEEEAHP